MSNPHNMPPSEVQPTRIIEDDSDFPNEGTGSFVGKAIDVWNGRNRAPKYRIRRIGAGALVFATLIGVGAALTSEYTVDRRSYVLYMGEGPNDAPLGNEVCTIAGHDMGFDINKCPKDLADVGPLPYDTVVEVKRTVIPVGAIGNQIVFAQQNIRTSLDGLVPNDNP